MIKTAEYSVELRLNGVLIGNVQPLVQNLTWARRRTMAGVDSIDFTLNDVLFARWCERRNTTIQDMLKPYALDCRIIRNGTPVVGGFLAKETVVSTLSVLFAGEAVLAAALTPAAALAFLVFCLLYTPCVAAIAGSFVLSLLAFLAVTKPKTLNVSKKLVP